MNVALPQTQMTVDEYLAWAEGKPGRFELVDGWVFAMAPERARHALAKGEAYWALRSAVEALRLPCQVFPDGMTVRIDKHTAREPDVSVQCGKKVDLDSTNVDSPLVVVEVVSSSERKDNDLLLEYFSIPSIQHYLIVHPKKRVVTHHRRNHAGTIDTRIARDGENIELAPPGMSVAVTALLGPVAASVQEH